MSGKVEEELFQMPLANTTLSLPLCEVKRQHVYFLTVLPSVP